MPKRTDIDKILIIGSGPIIIGQAAEFDYSGTQACKALLEEGHRVVLVNNNPATIMTDPEFSHHLYLEPLIPEVVTRIIERERPDALLPTVGGQMAINIAVTLAQQGILDRYGVELIGAKLKAMEIAEDRQQFKETMDRAGIPTPAGEFANTLDQALEIVQRIGLPVIIRPSYTLGGEGSGITEEIDSVREAVVHGLARSPIDQVLIEASVIGWKEFELEVMRDLADNVVVITSIENVDPMGIHTGDSITVAPAQTLSDREYQWMRNLACQVIRSVGVETGGANIQFAVDPEDGRMVVIEMNPRVSRSSALASKATGFPIAKIAAKLAIGYTLDEIPNDITRETPASFEPTIDYVVVKVPRWDLEKFPDADDRLGTQMKSVGETMAIGRTFKEALQKGLRSLEIDVPGLIAPEGPEGQVVALETLRIPTPDRIFRIYGALRTGVPVEQIATLTRIDPWFIDQLRQIADLEAELQRFELASVPKALLRRAKRWGFSDEQLARIFETDPMSVREARHRIGIRPVFKQVDTCGAEFEAHTPYLYSCYDDEDEVLRNDRKRVVILGSGPNRIGQGVEFDYCCCHAAFALHEIGYETIMVNCNPETVSTDYDTSDKLYFEPIAFEDVMNIIEAEAPDGVIVQYGGQTPLKLARMLKAAGVPIWGTDPDDIDLAEDRGRFGRLLEELGLERPEYGIATSVTEALHVARKIGYPVLVRPSYVLGGRAMAIVHGQGDLERYMANAVRVSPDHPVLIDRFLEDAIEIDVDAVADGHRCFIGGIMEHIEAAGVHSGDSACVLPPISLDEAQIEAIHQRTARLAARLRVVGLMNVQYAIHRDRIYVLEVNPRASRTVPFVSKATGRPLAKLGAQVMAGFTLTELDSGEAASPGGYYIKEAVFPFDRFGEVDPVLGPEMRSTGEVIGIAQDFGSAFAKAEIGGRNHLPTYGAVLISVNDRDKPGMIPIVRRLVELGFQIIATRGTAGHLRRNEIAVDPVRKLSEGHPNIIDQIEAGRIDLIINTPSGPDAYRDGRAIRINAIRHRIPYITTLAGARAAVAAITALQSADLHLETLDRYHTIV
ncbi:MAG: carbamoyl-phosphate synthase large subunit [Candidatus Bipolaricaulia bacterium]